MLRRRPALRFTLLLAGGILLAEVQAIPAHWLFAFLFAAFLAASFLGFLVRTSLAGSVLMQTAIVLLGMNLEAVQKEHSISRRLSLWNKPDTLVIRGELEDEPSVHGKTVRMILRGIPSWENQHSDSSVRRFIVIASARKFIGLTSRWNIGHAVAIRGTLDEFPRPRNPGEFDYGKYLTLNEIDGIVWLADTLPAPPPSGKWNPGIWFASQREGFGEIFDGLHGPQQAGFLRGVVFGDRREIPTELKESFVNTGTIHILAVSGSNVAMIALGLYMILGIFRIPKHWIVALTILGLLYYMMVTGAASSIVRATIMGCVILIGQMLERRSDVYNSLSVSAMIILLLSPSQLFDTGFQLSFAAVLSIVSIYPRLNTFIRRIPSRFEEIKAVDSVLKLFAVSLAAQLGTLPFTAYYFERFSVVSLAANLVVVPLVGVNLMLGCLTLIASAVSSWIAASYAALNEVLVSFLLGFVQAAASVPYAAVETAGFSLTSATIFYLCLVCALNPGSRAVLKAGVAGLLIVGIASTIPFLTLNPGGTLRVTALDVGQGDAILIEFPNKTTMLIDAGPKDPGYDAGERILLPFLKRRGITRIDRLIVSHPHSDHIGGMPSLLATMSVGMIMEADTATASRLHRSVRTAAGGGTEWRRVHIGTELSPDPSARVYCLSPSALSDPNLNNRSVVVKVMYGQTSVLLSGDAEKEAEKDVYRRFGPFLDSDILKAGHHGSSTSSSAPFLDSITPNFAIISVGKRNKFGHPSPDVVRELERRETRVLRTDREGAIIFESDGTRWEQRHWRTEEPH